MTLVQIVTSSHVSMNPRVWREANALAAAEFEVVVTCGWYSERHVELDRRLARESRWKLNVGFDLTGTSLQGRAGSGWIRAQHFAARRFERLIPALRRDALGYGVRTLTKVADRVHAAYTIGHGEVAYDVIRRLAARGAAVGIDLDDWVSENQDASTPAQWRAFLRSVEQDAARVARGITTASEALARALEESLHPASSITAVYNSVPSISRDELAPAREGEMQVIWMSQTIGPTRGLELLFEAVQRIPGFRVTLLGDVPKRYAKWLRRLTDACDPSRVTVLSPVFPTELTAVLSRHDLGCALEVPYCRNKDLTVSNKILHYLQSGLYVAASGTEGHREILRQLPGSGRVFAAQDIAGFMQVIEECMKKLAEIRAKRSMLSEQANALFSYERQGAKVVRVLENAIEKRVER